MGLFLVLARIRIPFLKLRVSIGRPPRGRKSVPESSGLRRGKTRRPSSSGGVKSRWEIGGWVSALRGLDGVVFSDIDGIRRVLSSFYSSLFSAEDVDLAAQDFLFGNLASSLSPQQAETCEGPLTVAGCHRALLGMARRKALTVSPPNSTFAFGMFLGRTWYMFSIFVFPLVF